MSTTKEEYIPKQIQIKRTSAHICKKIANMGLNIALVLVTFALITSICTGYKPLFVMSPSMEPVIMTHQLVLAKRVHDSGHDMNVGDIITYQRPNEFKTITHRIIQTEDDGYIVKGDNNASADPYTVKPEWIKYKIIKY